MVLLVKALIGGGILALLFGGGRATDGATSTGDGDGGGGGGDDTVTEPPFVADPAAEQLQCKAAADEKPLELGDRKRQVGEPLARWLGWVAYRRAYPNGPHDPMTTDWREALRRLTECVDVRLKEQPGPPPADQVPEPPTPVDKPKPGVYYQLQKGDTLLGVSSATYGTKGGANLTAARRINDAPQNKRFHVEAPQSEQNWWKTRITFLPKFGTWPEQWGDDKTGAAGKGTHYAVIWLPEAQ